MREKREKKEKRSLSPVEGIMMFFMFGFFVFSLGYGLSLQGAITRNAIVRVGWQETATYVHVQGRGDRSSWNKTYRYIDDDGTEYSSRVPFSNTSKTGDELREAIIGTTVVITIDGKGNSTTATEKQSMALPAVLISVFALLFIGDIVLLIVVHKKKDKRWIAEREAEVQFALEHPEIVEERIQEEKQKIDSILEADNMADLIRKTNEEKRARKDAKRKR